MIYEVLWQYRNLELWAANDPAVRVVKLEVLSTDLGALQELADWIGIGLTVTEEMMRPRNAMGEKGKWFRWGEAEMELLRTIAGRLQFEGIREQIGDRVES